MGLSIGNLLLLDGLNLLQQSGLIVFFHLVQCIEQLNDLKVFVGRIPFYIELKIALFGLFKGFNKLKQGITRPVRHHIKFKMKRSTGKGFSK